MTDETQQVPDDEIGHGQKPDQGDAELPGQPAPDEPEVDDDDGEQT